MALDTRVVRRTNGTYAFRGSVPAELRGLIPGGASGQKWISLGTRDPAQAKRLARRKSVEFDQQLAAARRKLSGKVDDLSLMEAERLASMWLSARLAEDEAERRQGFDEGEWIDRVEDDAAVVGMAGAALAKGDASFVTFTLDAIAEQQGLNLAPGSAAWDRLASSLLRAGRRYAEAVRDRNAGEVVDTPAPPKAASAPRSCTVNDLIDAYLSDPTKTRSAGTLKTYATVFRAMRELLGGTTPVDSVHRQDCERIRAVLMRLPKNASQRFPGMSLEDAAKAADVQSLERLGVAAVNNYLHNLSALFKWGVEGWRVTRNPAVGLALPDDRDEQAIKQPFTTEHLRAIFNAPLFKGCQDDEEGYAKPGPNVIRRGRFWVPLLSLWTGMRLGECCQLHVDDVADIEGTPVILIAASDEPGGDEADRKRVKTEAGKRFVPVHPELTRMDFLSFVERARKEGRKRLFPELKPDSLGYHSGVFSKFFNDKRRFLGKLGIAGQGVSFHSFRHNYRDALREADISLERVRMLGGWSKDSEGEEARYGKGLLARTLMAEIEKVSYPGLDLSHLHSPCSAVKTTARPCYRERGGSVNGRSRT